MKKLKWLLFGTGIGTLVSSGIYLYKGLDEGFGNWNAVRMVSFFIAGTLCILMYGENKY